MMTKKSVRNNRRGSYTVEAVIVFTFIVLILFAFVFGTMVLYQQMCLQKAINSAVIGAADTMGYLGDDNRLLEEVIKNQVNEQLKTSMLKVPDASEMLTFDYEDRNIFMAKRIKIEIKQDVTIPLGQIKQFFTGNQYLRISASTYMIEDSTVKSIRDTDLAIELVSRAWDKAGIFDIIKDLLKIQ